MVTIAELVEIPVDWIDELADSAPDRARLRRLVDEAEGSYERLMFPGWGMYLIYSRHRNAQRLHRKSSQIVISDGVIGYFPDGPSFGVRVLDELHNFLCMNDPRCEEDRTQILKDFKIGQAGLVAAATTAITPYLGAGSVIVGPCVAIVLTLTGRVGLGAWCAAQSERRRRAGKLLAEARRKYESETARQEQMRRQRQSEQPGDNAAARPRATE